MFELIFFSSKTCVVCGALKPKLLNLANEFGIPFKEIDISENPAESGKFLVFSAPTVVLTKNGKEINRWSGVFSVNEISVYLSRIFR